MSIINPTDIEATKYAENFVLYGDKSRAFRAAFPKTKSKPEAINVNAVKFHSSTKVQLRVEALHKAINSKADEDALYTAQDAIRELEEARQVALDHDQAAPMVSASMGKSKIAGLLVDKQELTGKGGADLIPEGFSFVPYKPDDSSS